MFSSQGILGAAPDWWHAAEAQLTAPSNIQHSSRIWLSKSLQPSWAEITTSSSSGGLPLALDKTSAVEGKTHSCENSKFPHEEQVLSCAHEEGGVPLPALQEQSHIPDCLLQSPFGTQRTTNSFSARGSFLSFITQRDRIPAKYTVEDSPGDKKLLLFLNRLVPQDMISDTYCLPASRKKNKRRTFFLHKVSQEAYTYTVNLWLAEKEPTRLAVTAGRTREHWDLDHYIFSLVCELQKLNPAGGNSD